MVVPSSGTSVRRTVISESTDAPSTDVEYDVTVADTSISENNFTNGAGLNYVKAMQYAELWTDAAHKDKMNPKYPDYGDTNCTNFVSQAMEAGGLKTTSATVRANRALANNAGEVPVASSSWLASGCECEPFVLTMVSSATS